MKGITPISKHLKCRSVPPVRNGFGSKGFCRFPVSRHFLSVFKDFVIFPVSRHFLSVFKDRAERQGLVFQKSENFPKICLIKCLKGHKFLGSLCYVVKALIVSGNGQTDQASKGQGHLLSCSAKKNGTLTVCHFSFVWQ